MKKFSKIAIISALNISDSAKKRIQTFSKDKVVFPESSSQNENEIIKRIGNADAVLGTYSLLINKTILDKCINIKYIGVCGTSMINIDLSKTARRGIRVTNVTDYGDEATAEYIFTQLLILARGFDTYMWKDNPSELNSKTLGIIGLGHVGQQVARLALGFNMRVLYFSRTRKLDWEKKGLKYTTFKKLIKEADIISLHIPENLLTLKREDFKIIRNGTIIVDTSLGVVMDVRAFQRWKERGKNYLIIDKNKRSFLEGIKDYKNIIGYKNEIAGMTIESKERLSKKVINNIKTYLKI